MWGFYTLVINLTRENNSPILRNPSFHTNPLLPVCVFWGAAQLGKWYNLVSIPKHAQAPYTECHRSPGACTVVL